MAYVWTKPSSLRAVTDVAEMAVTRPVWEISVEKPPLAVGHDVLAV